MSQAAALYLTASKYADDATTQAARHYYLGVRDAFESVMRGCHEIPDDVEPMVYAVGLLSNMDDDARNAVLSGSRSALRSRRRETIALRAAVI